MRALRWIGLLFGIVVAAAAVVVGIAAFGRTVDTARDIGERGRDPALIATGRYLAVAADCVNCHTSEGGFDFAGGRAIATPFGTIFSPNITPDAATGIGGWTAGRFEVALVEGGSFWRPLYPAMPYTSYHLIRRDDIDALYAYFMSLRPVAAAEKPDELSFPFDIRQLMIGWNLLFLDRAEYAPDPAKTGAWNRGFYLATALGHCGECHTPRGAFGELKSSRALAGAVVNDLSAPDIRPAALKANGWTRDDLVTFFRSGAGPKGSAFGDMFLTVKRSLRHLDAGDQTALAVYLLDESGEEPSKGDAAIAASGAPGGDGRGEALYLTYCGLCHGSNGNGVPKTFPPIAGSETVAEPDGINLVTIVARGIGPERMSLVEGYGPMPAFADRMSTEDMTELVNYVRRAFAPGGVTLAPLSAATVAGIAGNGAQ